MFDFSRAAEGELAPTVTCHYRGWGYTPFAFRLGDNKGLLRIEMVRGKRLEYSVYLVADGEMIPGLVGWRFRLTTIFGDKPGQAYEVLVGGLARCDCQAGQHRGEKIRSCKHLDALAALVEELYPEALDNQRSGLAFPDRPGEPTAAEPTAAEPTAAELAAPKRTAADLDCW